MLMRSLSGLQPAEAALKVRWQLQTAAVAGGSDCAAGVKRATELNPAVAQFNQVKVNHVEIQGDRASVTGAVPSIKKNATFKLQRVNGKWLVSGAGG
jgi:hypothetical protein